MSINWKRVTCLHKQGEKPHVLQAPIQQRLHVRYLNTSEPQAMG
jgi:hypothetical protein